MVKKKKRVWPKILLGLVVVIVVIVGALIWKFNSTVNKVKTVEIDKEDLNINEEQLDKYEYSKDIVNIALFGVDSEEGQAGRSDSIMILTVDTIHNKIKLTSIMRDSYVNISGRGMDKINHAYAFGKEQLALQTINENFGLNVKDYALVNFTSLPEIVDALNGVDLEIKQDEIEYLNQYIDSINALEGTSSAHITTAGTQHLDGVQTLAYARIRYTDGGDYVRTERHRTVLTALFKEILDKPTTEYLSMLDKLLPYVQTSMNSSSILSLATNTLTAMSSPTIQQERLPLDGYSEGVMIDGIYYLSFDIDYTKEKFMDYIFNDIPME